MRILGIESSCDETAAAVVEDGQRILTNVVHSQIDQHEVFGGVIPEVAARSHIEMILPVIDRAVIEAYKVCHPELSHRHHRTGSEDLDSPPEDDSADLREKAWSEIDAIAATTMPGLIGSLLIGALAGRTLALVKDKPFFPTHHVEAHVYANFITEKSKPTKQASDAKHFPSQDHLLRRGKASKPPRNDGRGAACLVEGNGEAERDDLSNAWIPDRVWNEKVEIIRKGQPAFPMLALIVSGGHSQIVLFRDHGDYSLIGQTADDAVGEAFDKVAKILGLPYPGGPSIARAAENGDPHKYKLPKSRMQNPYDFSFSGLKTAVLRAVQSEAGVDHTFPSFQLAERLTPSQRDDFAASFQNIAVETLVDKVVKAFNEFQPKSVVIAGGVAANQELRRQLRERLPIAVEYPPIELCTDNAAMVASLGYFMAQKVTPTDPRDVEVIPSISMTKTAWKK